MATLIQHENVKADQIIPSTIGDYADRGDIERLLDVDLAPYQIANIVYHRYRIEVSNARGLVKPGTPSFWRCALGKEIGRAHV